MSDEPRAGGLFGIETIKTYLIAILVIVLVFSLMYIDDLSHEISFENKCFRLLVKYVQTPVLHEIYNETRGFEFFGCKHWLLDYSSELSQKYNVSVSELEELIICLARLR